jgi:hypothetical protein
MSELQDFHPQPIDTAMVELPVAVHELIELLARNAHDVWAQSRLADGWHWGTACKDERKEHSCLTPHEEQPESEKDFDRAMAIGTLKMILTPGF